MKIHKILLIAPDAHHHQRKLIRMARTVFYPLALPQIASLTPMDIETEIIDETVQKLDYNTKTDLVAITANTTSINRAYEIAAEFRRRGKTVVMGGIHVSALPQEALQYADCVVVGEAEIHWVNLLRDYNEGNLKSIYKSEELPDIKYLSRPKYELMQRKSYILPNVVQTTRGCPFECSFCSVHKYFGGKYRMRDIGCVVGDIRYMQRWSPNKPFIFYDDNIFGKVERAEELMKAITPLNLDWFGQASINTLQDDNFLELAHRSGCRMIFVGLESLSEDNLKDINKKWNKPEIMKETVARLHRHQIAMLGAFIVGLPNDDLNVVAKITDFIQEAKIPIVQLAILIPLPDTTDGDRLNPQIFDPDYSKRDGSRMVFYHSKISPPFALERAIQEAYLQIYSTSAVKERLKGIEGDHIKFVWKVVHSYQLSLNKWIKRISLLGQRG